MSRFSPRARTMLLLLAGGLVLGLLGFRTLALERERAAQLSGRALSVLKQRLKGDAERLARKPRGRPLLAWRVEPATLPGSQHLGAELHVDRLRRAAGYDQDPALSLPRWEALGDRHLPTWVRHIAALGAGRCCLALGRFEESDKHFELAAQASPLLVSLDGARVASAALRYLAASGLRAGRPEPLRRLLTVAEDGARIVDGDVQGPAEQLHALSVSIDQGRVPRPPAADWERLQRAIRHAHRGHALLKRVGSRGIIVAEGELAIRHASFIGRYPLQSLLEAPPPGYPPAATVHVTEPDAPLDARSVRLDGPLASIVLRVRPEEGGLAGIISGIVLALGLLVYVCGSVFALRGWQRSRRAARMQADFTAAVSHEMKTPIASVRAMAEMLDDGDPERTKRYAGRIEAEMQRLGTTVRNVLDASRIEQGGLPVVPVPLEPSVVLERTLESLRPELERRGFDVEAEFLPSERPIAADADALDGVLRNLVDNAAKFSRDVKRIRVEGLPTPEGYRVAVLDRGVGLERGKHERLFERYYRGDAAREGAVPGVGLGLHIARQVIHAHGGTLRARSRDGGGAVFEIHLPAGNA